MDQKIWKKYSVDSLPYLTGIVLVLLSFLPMLFLGDKSAVNVHDQLDGEVIAYLLHAKYLGTGISFYPEWMGGVDQTALTPPALLPILFYRFLKPFAAFLLIQVMAALTAFGGMYWYLKICKIRSLIAWITALCFALLPFYSVYGLCVAGIPMVMAAALELLKNKKKVRNILFLLFYGFLSSFVLVGFAVVSILWLYLIYHMVSDVRKKIRPVGCLPLGAGVFLLTVYYGLTNLDLVMQVLGRSTGFISHKSELLLWPIPFFISFSQMLFEGSSHASSLHGWLVIPVLLLILWAAFSYRTAEQGLKRKWRILAGFYLAAILIALFYAFLHWEPVTELRNTLGGVFVYFQIDRFYWLYPWIWYTILAFFAEILYELISKKWKEAAFCAAGVFLVTASIIVVWNSHFKKNIRQWINPQSSNQITWDGFYATNLFSEIKEVIGREPESYRVASIGLHPAIAAYNGLYTVDGYSNNYALSYKVRFQSIIQRELDKDSELRRYFEEWGNRCYLFSSELGQQYFIEKDSETIINQLDIDTEVLGQLGCEYVLSSVPIQNAKQLNLHFIQVFEKAEYKYEVYLYEAGEF